MKELFSKTILDITFLSINSTAFDVQGLSISKGQKIKIALRGLNDEHKISWFANNDEVLDIVDHGAHAEITAATSGTSEVIIKTGGKVLHTIIIEVIKNIPVATKTHFVSKIEKQ